jgi:hypothetical protein
LVYYHTKAPSAVSFQSQHFAYFSRYHLNNVTPTYGSSIITTLASLYPDYPWDPWRFRFVAVPHGYWDDLKNQRKFFDSVYKEFGLQKPEDWWNVKLSDIKKAGGSTVLSKYDTYLRLAYSLLIT